MAHYPAPDVMRAGVLFKHSVENTQCEMTFEFQDGTGAIFADPATFEDGVWNAVVDHLVPVCSPEVVFNGIVLEDIRSVPYGGATYIHPDTPGTNGTSDKPLPTSTCVAFKRLTATLGRSGRGRVYFPIWDGSLQVSADQVPASFLAGVVDALNAFQAEVAGLPEPATMVLVSFQTGGVPNNPGVVRPVVEWAATDGYVDNQRRRLVGRGG